MGISWGNGDKPRLTLEILWTTSSRISSVMGLVVARHYLLLEALGETEPPTQAFSTPLLGSTSIIYSFLVGFKLGKFTGVATDVYQSIQSHPFWDLPKIFSLSSSLKWGIGFNWLSLFNNEAYGFFRSLVKSYSLFKQRTNPLVNLVDRQAWC